LVCSVVMAYFSGDAAGSKLPASQAPRGSQMTCNTFGEKATRN
jgi:hypothetical protein